MSDYTPAIHLFMITTRIGSAMLTATAQCYGSSLISNDFVIVFKLRLLFLMLLHLSNTLALTSFASCSGSTYGIGLFLRRGRPTHRLLTAASCPSGLWLWWSTYYGQHPIFHCRPGLSSVVEKNYLLGGDARRGFVHL